MGQNSNIRHLLEEDEIRKKLSMRRVMIPVLIGLLAAFYVLYRSLNEVRYEKTIQGQGQYDLNLEIDIVDVSNPEQFHPTEEGNYRLVTVKESIMNVDWSAYSILMLLLALMFLFFRVMGYVMRLRVLSEKQLSMKQSLNVVMLWEFASSITPSVVGGAGIAIFFLGREKISLGKSTAIVMITAMMDELFYVIVVPIAFFLTIGQDIFPVEWRQDILGFNLTAEGVFWFGYSFIFVLIFILIYAVFINPRGFRYLLLKLFNIRFLKKWKYKVIEWGNDLVTASNEFKTKKLNFWLKTFGWTFFSWTSRFLLLNCLIMIVVPNIDQMFVYTKQLAMWVIMLISPTPGGAGLAEVAFYEFFGGSVVPVALVGFLAILWRLLTYFPYLFSGVIILPTWLKNTSKSTKS